MQLPSRPYVALYGSNTEYKWRVEAAARLQAHGVPCYDPADQRWQQVTEQTGDQQQRLVDELVTVQRHALTHAACVLFHMARVEGNSPAARFELGMLSCMPQLPVFLHVAPDTLGRNYVWAQARLSPNFQTFETMDHALDAVMDWYGKLGK
uniref:TIR domain-containing protein n=1 Tax=Chlamydomonas chlamydogama TaxID=225041 RepID=A0A7S2QSN1_9CHLO|mmetsp:Transcript_1262/g.2730  ORF Transcript_1262/g.2730 Transcript_1262/m.2730 type:complete len:151 (+) Transcript_1262:261-713(+)